jgi:hypothetical protein
VDPVKVEPILKTIFKIASRWKALLLLDEADVFLAQRSENVQLNALVSVFLRELEHYDGILFLTTNRLQAFDEAVLSRVYLALRYEKLKQEARAAVWKYFLEQVRAKHGRPAFSREVIADLAKEEINGREVRDILLCLSALTVRTDKKCCIPRSVHGRVSGGGDEQETPDGISCGEARCPFRLSRGWRGAESEFLSVAGQHRRALFSRAGGLGRSTSGWLCALSLLVLIKGSNQIASFSSVPGGH